MPGGLREPNESDSSGQGSNGSLPGRAGTSFTDLKGNTFYYDDNGIPKYVGLSINGTPPKPASEIKAPMATGLLGPGAEPGGTGPSRSGFTASRSTDPASAPSATDYPMSYNVGSSDYQIAARKAFDDYLGALGRGDSKAAAKAQRGLEANPPDFIKPDTGPQMGAYDPEAAAQRARRFQDGILGAVSLPAAWSGGLATMLGEDDATRSRWMEGGAEIGSEFSPFVAEATGLLGNPAARESLRPVGVPGDIGEKGATLEGAATLAAHQRGAVVTFNGKFAGDRGFDGAYVLHDKGGYPQLHIDSVKAYKGRVPVSGRGSMTELGTNKLKTRKEAEKVLRENIESTPTNDNFTPDDKTAVLDQLEKGDVVLNLVGQPETVFHQGHVDFINSEIPYRLGTIHTLDPFTPSKAPLLQGASYGLLSVYSSDPTAEKH